jgi:hypothetical protein
MTKRTSQLIDYKRHCDGCTMCCEGWLTGESHGYEFYPGLPCHFVGCNGCSIYENRPDEPCKSFACSWLNDNFLPEWFKPNQSNLICNWEEWEKNCYFLSVIECGKQIEAKYLNWLKKTSNYTTDFNVRYTISGTIYYLGSDKFLQYMNKMQQSNQNKKEKIFFYQ